MNESIIENPIKGEIYSVQRLEEFATYLASQLKVSGQPKVTQTLLPRMRDNGKQLLTCYRILASAIQKKESIPPAAEWLTDNFHIVEDQLREIQEDLPPKFYKELPKIVIGELTGYPRIYAIALAIVAHTDSQLEPETIRRFIQAYQQISPLGTGELWALAITLRLVLVENLRRIAIRVVSDQEKRNLANIFADQIFESVGNKENFEAILKDLPFPAQAHVLDDTAFLAQMTKRLRDQEPELWPALERVEKFLQKAQTSTEQIVHISHHSQAASQVTVANIITSMRLISSMDWKDFFESVSLVDRVLEKDAVYGRMDFPTRDRYRHVIEGLAKKSKSTEISIAESAIQLAQEYAKTDPQDQKRTHVGYYLLGQGVERLEASSGSRSKTRRLAFAHRCPNFIYFGLMGLLSLAICAIPLYYSYGFGTSTLNLVLIALLIVIPCTELALRMGNILLTHILRPHCLPRMDYSEGVSAEGRTMVVIPCLMSGAQVIHDLLEKLEIHYLGNTDPQLFFALLTDFTDSPTEKAASDDKLLQLTLDGIGKLNQKYAKSNQENFFLFHRKRLWNPSENAWIGWERKRGKIEEFNKLLTGDADTTFTTHTAPRELLSSIRYIITLDADTQLPRDAAHKLVGTIMHPLNHPYFDKVTGRVTEGYGILQPRVGISLESSTRSLFAKIFSGFSGIDPYTTAVSDVYQDLYFEGSYVGKGLYSVDAFRTALHSKVPENTILSHDLFEGIYARAALVTDVELIDDYPQTYQTFFTRLHRWTRGDWQIAEWLLPLIPTEKGDRVRSQMPLIGRWKIFDNLRRSLVSPCLFLWFIFSATLLPGDAWFWILYAALTLFLPVIVAPLVAATYGLLRKGFKGVPPAFDGVLINFAQGFLYIAFLAHQSVIQLDAISRVFYRRLFSKTKLLEWTASAQVESRKNKGRKPFWQTPWVTEILLLVSAGFVVLERSEIFAPALILILIWMAYPLLANLISERRSRQRPLLQDDDKSLARMIARRTWHYFETYVIAGDNWLPPDNHQEQPFPVTAHRTSPTNMGLYLLSLSAARDLGYVSSFHFIEKLRANIATLEKMPQYEGHYYNWYDTQSLQPLTPQYISTVDSGNLAGYFIPVRETCLEIINAPVFEKNILVGALDALNIALQEIEDEVPLAEEMAKAADICKKTLETQNVKDLQEGLRVFRSSRLQIEELKKVILETKESSPELKLDSAMEWADLALRALNSALADMNLILPWTHENFTDPAVALGKFSPEVRGKWEKILARLNQHSSFSGLLQSYDFALEGSGQILSTIGNSPEAGIALLQAVKAIDTAKITVAELLRNAETASNFLDEKFRNMNFAFLLEKESGVFSIGYSVTDRKFDSGTYDLLASESRLASFIAIAKGDIPQEHWFRLGRQLVPTSSGRALVSWTASMFEYLMPALVMRDYENTLIEETLKSVVARQISYGREHNVPWGISEAGYNARDIQLNYQYGPFGVPGLGLKSGLSHDLVISPYSTCLAAMVDPIGALKNMKRLVKDDLLTAFGFYESIDYTVERLPKNQKSVVIRSFMAHHQGMSLVAINNVVNSNVMQDRFHRDLRVRATSLLLQEKVPRGVTVNLPKATEFELEDESPVALSSFVRRYNDPNGHTPRIQLLSNRQYSIMISTAGGGYSKCDDLAITRWREDATTDNWGQFIFIRDTEKNKVWSTTYQPLTQMPDSYEVIFGEEKVEFKRYDDDILTDTQILVAPEDNVEIRHVTITNNSEEPRILELTSYLEPVLAKPGGDLDHQAFSKLFLQTEFLSSKNTLLAKRRKRAEHENEPWTIHGVVTDGAVVGSNGAVTGPVEYETDRAKFIGRGRNLTNALAMQEGQNLTNTAGATLDPIFSLRIKILLPPNGKMQVAFTTGFAGSREKALELADRYHDIHSFERESKLAWTKSQVDMRHLNINSETAYLYQKIAERILYSEPSLRPSTYQRAVNTTTQSRLWTVGISGDLPLIVVRIRDQKDMAIIRQLLRCHEYLRLKGLAYDFVIFNEHATTYFQGLQDEISEQIRSQGSWNWLNKPGGIFILRSDLIPEKDIAHIQSVARISITADQPLKEQITRKVPEEKYPPARTFRFREAMDFPETPATPALDFFNGLGGFSADGKEYVTVLRSGQWTPAPWINVIGNKQDFGFQVSECGSGFTWSVNSQANRLTPWSNDPVCDPPGEIIYLRDDDTGEIWTPTPLPIRSDEPYTIRHGQGYTTFEHIDHGIHHKLTLFVPKDATIKISHLEIKNLTDRKRRISITSYTEWVLGTQREKTSSLLLCEQDLVSGAIFARNPFDNEFSARVAFADVSAAKRTFTCSRKEFLGRNGNYLNPAALTRDGLSQKRGTGQDPCAVLQMSIELDPDSRYEMAVLLGQCEDAGKARELSLHYRDLDVVRRALTEVKGEWLRLTSAVQVKTPDAAMNALMNSWLLYQTISCRYWSRTAFYQSGGAYGFRDQLQDCMSFVYSAPEIAREHILRASKRQFKEGDVQHWWHPPYGRGVRTRMTDDLLWLPFVVSFYIQVTKDNSILKEVTAFLEAPLLKEHQEDSYTQPQVSSESVTVFEHCIRAMDYSMHLGSHGIPLIGTGDWNDGMNRVGAEGKGESIWLGWFFYRVLADFMPFLQQPEQSANREKYLAHMEKLKTGLEEGGWDGQWYKRAYYDDGSALGSAANDECRIDSIAQSWAVLSQAGNPERARQAMSQVYEQLVRKDASLIMLFTPPFDKTAKDPGYIKGYVPGVRENGGQYTHAAVWTMMAFAELGEGDRAFELFSMLNPILRTRNSAECEKYKIEPYVLAGDIYSCEPHVGRGGWSWYTGSSGWYYRGALENVLGFQLRGEKLSVKPCIPKTWKTYDLQYQFGTSKYSITINNPDGLNTGRLEYELDGVKITETEITLVRDGKNHKVIATMKA